MNIFFTKQVYNYTGLFRRKKVFIFLLIFAALFLIHQLILMLILNKSQSNVIIDIEPSASNSSLFGDNHFRGVRPLYASKYNPDKDGMFMCFRDDIKIPMSDVNDDFCDCPTDGSDEPGTNACNNGHFFCTMQIKHHTGRGGVQIIPSYKVNDGICDCCDGSDEWNGTILKDVLTKILQMKLHKFQAPCPNTCLRL